MADTMRDAEQMSKEWVAIDEYTSSGKQLFACTGCGVRHPAPTRFHICQADAEEPLPTGFNEALKALREKQRG